MFLVILSVVDDVSATGSIIYVNGSSGNDNNNGFSWNTAKLSINNATGNLNGNGTIYIANGNYSGDNNRNILIEKNMTIIGEDKEHTIIDAEKLDLIFIINNGLNFNIQNITLINGNSTNGGAISNDGSNLTVTNSIFTNNTAVSNGGAIYNSYSSNLTITDTIFIYNNGYYGGAIYNSYGSNLRITNATFTNNTATYGGALSNDFNCVSNITNSVFMYNLANDDGGTISNSFNSSLIVTNTIFTNNAANYDGGAISNSYYSNLKVTNSLFSNNTSNYGGALNNDFYCNLNVTNCNFTSNNANYGGAIANTFYCNLTVTCSDFTNNTANYGGAVSNSFSNPEVPEVHFNRIVGNTAKNAGSDIYSSSGSVNATKNWWGTNSNPISRISGSLTVSPWLVINITANPTYILCGGISNITADLLHDSIGEYHDPANGHVPDGIPVTFTSTLGTISSLVSTVNGIAKVTLNGGAVTGVADVSATVDSQTVHTSVTIDNTAPTVTSTNPTQYAVNLPANQVFTVTYNEPIKAGNLNLVVLKTSTGTIINATKSITGNVLTITPTTALSEAKYLLMLYAGCVTDLAGNPAAATTRTYSVGAQPYVTSTNPANYAVNVPRNTAITATFNEPILAKYLTLIYLKTTTGVIIATTKSVSGNVLTITPTSPLAAGTRYMLLIYTFAVTDLSGNSNVNKAISFTTGAT